MTTIQELVDWVSREIKETYIKFILPHCRD